MKMKRMILGVMMGALLTGTTSFAQIRQRQENQQDRIGEGVENGSLTPKETSQLEHQETRLNKQIGTTARLAAACLRRSGGRSTISRTC